MELLEIQNRAAQLKDEEFMKQIQQETHKEIIKSITIKSIDWLKEESTDTLEGLKND